MIQLLQLLLQLMTHRFLKSNYYQHHRFVAICTLIIVVIQHIQPITCWITSTTITTSTKWLSTTRAAYQSRRKIPSYEVRTHQRIWHCNLYNTLRIQNFYEPVRRTSNEKCLILCYNTESENGNNDDPTTIVASSTSSSSSESSSENDSKKENIVVFPYTIRDCTYTELVDVADIILDCFYTPEQINGMWRQLYKMGELNRIQQNYSYGDDRILHKTIVACTAIKFDDNSNNKKQAPAVIVGYVDIDVRPATNYNRGTFSYNPRPYLSDLCVHPNYQRRGVAKALIQYCEKYCLSLPADTIRLANTKFQSTITTLSSPKTATTMKDFIIQNNELYIRVEKTNNAAITMYTQLGYKQIHNPDDPDGKEIIILYKKLNK